jgi:hypothetical protein
VTPGKSLALVLAAGAAALVPLSAGAAPSKTLRFKIMSGSATATLTFDTANAQNDETTDGRIALTAKSNGRGSAAVPGSAKFAISSRLSERVTIHHDVSGTSPYEESCTNVRKVAGRGGVTLKRRGKAIEVRWAFPQAKPSFCQGPNAASGLLTRMKRVYPSKVFNGKRVTLVLNGSAKVPGESSSATYRWHAVVKLKRA